MKHTYVHVLCLTLLLSVLSYADIPYVFVTEGDSGIARMGLDGTGYEIIISASSEWDHLSSELAVDSSNKKLYYDRWGYLNRCDFDGSNAQSLFHYTGQAGGIVVGGNNVYWADNYHIRCANVDTLSNSSIISGPGNIQSMAYDNVHDKLYYVAYEGNRWKNGGIYRADSDGGNIEKLVGDIGTTMGIAVDPYNNKMYWASRGGAYESIKSANLDGTAITDIINSLQNPMVEIVDYLEIDLTAQKLYWTDQGSIGKTQRINLDGTGYEVIRSGGGPFGIALYVPEPATLLLLGLGGLAIMKRRKA